MTKLCRTHFLHELAPHVLYICIFPTFFCMCHLKYKSFLFWVSFGFCSECIQGVTPWVHDVQSNCIAVDLNHIMRHLIQVLRSYKILNKLSKTLRKGPYWVPVEKKKVRSTSCDGLYAESRFSFSMTEVQSAMSILILSLGTKDRGNSCQAHLEHIRQEKYLQTR